MFSSSAVSDISLISPRRVWESKITTTLHRRPDPKSEYILLRSHQASVARLHVVRSAHTASSLIVGRHRALGLCEEGAHRGDKECRGSFAQSSYGVILWLQHDWLMVLPLRLAYGVCQGTREQLASA